MMFLITCLPWAGCSNQAGKSADSDEGVLNPSRDFSLYDQDGKIFNLRDHRGQIVLLFFGYTSCPDVCPTTLSKLAINAVGLTGTKLEIDTVVDVYKATYEKVVTPSSALGYMFDHTDYLYLIDAQGKTTHLFHPDDKAIDMAQIIKGI